MTRRRLYFFLWVAVAVAAAIAITVMVRNELVILHGPPGDFSGYWLNEHNGRAQRVWRIEQSGGEFTIGGLRLGGKPAASATLRGAELVVSDSSTGSLWEARLGLQRDAGQILVKVWHDGTLVRRLTLVRLPTPSPANVEWSASPSGLAARTIEEGIRALELGIEAYRLERGSYPPVAAVRPDGALRQYVDGWPVDPYTNTPMAPGLEPGAYIYTLGEAGRSYTLAGLLPDGGQFVVP